MNYTEIIAALAGMPENPAAVRMARLLREHDEAIGIAHRHARLGEIVAAAEWHREASRDLAQIDHIARDENYRGPFGAAPEIAHARHAEGEIAIGAARRNARTFADCVESLEIATIDGCGPNTDAADFEDAADAAHRAYCAMLAARESATPEERARAERAVESARQTFGNYLRFGSEFRA